MKNFILFGLVLFVFGCSNTGTFTRAKTTGNIVSPSKMTTSSSGSQKLVPSGKVAQANRISNGLPYLQQPTIDSHNTQSRNFEDPPKGATLLNRANHQNIAQKFSDIQKNNPPKSENDVVKPIEVVEVEEQGAGVRINWFRLILFYLISGIFIWVVYITNYEKKRKNPFSLNENPFASKTPAPESSSGGGI